MEQYDRIKKEHPNELLFFRLGDFFEMFNEDAKEASRLLGITLTSRFKGDRAVPMAGVPHHSVRTYIARLLKAGKRIAVCEQLEEAEEAEGLVDRGVVRIITPGTLTELDLLDEKNYNYLLALLVDGQNAGLAWLDLSTGKFEIEDISKNELTDELARLQAAECLVPESQADSCRSLVQSARGGASSAVTPLPDWTFERNNALKRLTQHFNTANLDGFGCGDAGLSLSAAGAALEYLHDTQKTELAHITCITPFRRANLLVVDRTSAAALEIAETMRTGQREGSLLWVLDRCVTPMGSRLLRDWTTCPLSKVEDIVYRQNGVVALVRDGGARAAMQKTLKGTNDLERLAAKVGAGRANPRDILAIGQSLARIQPLSDITGRIRTKEPEKPETGEAETPVPRFHRSTILADVAGQLELCGELERLKTNILKAVADAPPIPIKEGGIFREGYDAELDGLRSIGRDGKKWLATFQADEIKRTGIPSLKIGYNQVFGYYIEVTNVHGEKIPSDYIRKQTLKNAERYVTPQLKDYETQVLTADERARKKEYELFVHLREEVARYIPALQKIAHAAAMLDVLTSLAAVAAEYGYCRPELNDSTLIEIHDGRHPVLERVLTERFVPNDVRVDASGDRILVITGPNMAGKSTYVRQVALLVLMAQTGSFVPARSARIGVVDRIFARVGASDEIMRGSSTFMVEMSETANILNNATARSLIILDEIGRGTSTFDGVSIAWAVAEYIHDRVGARTFFATHYHELTDLARVLPGVKNYQVAVREWGDGVVFLRKIVEGGTDKSYGIHVARLAGVPREVVESAKEILARLESEKLDVADMPLMASTAKKKSSPAALQKSLFGHPLPEAEAVCEALRKVEPDKLTPLEALARLADLKNTLKK